MNRGLTIIGAGLSGLTCAYHLQGLLNITMLEKSKGIGGRAATRRVENYSFDHGANYLSFDSLDQNQIMFVKQLLQKVDKNKEHHFINEPIFLFNEKNEITPTDKMSEKITFPLGINYFAKLIHQSIEQQNIALHKEKLVTHLEQIPSENGQLSPSTWRIFTKDNQHFSSDYVLLTAPGPQTMEIIKNSKFLDSNIEIQQTLINSLNQSQYYRQIAASIAVGIDISQKFPFYALVNPNKLNDVWWLSIENRKLSHVPNGNLMVIAQMSDQWSLNNWESTNEQIQKDIVQKVSDILKVPLDENLNFVNIQKWKFSLPKQKQIQKVDPNQLKIGENIGLFFSGDGLFEKGRLGLAIWSGHQVAQQILQNSKL